MYRTLFLIALWAMLSPVSLCAQTEMDSLVSRLKTAVQYDHRFPREKVFLHLDNNSYVVGDTLWAKAYVVRAATLRPQPLSRVLYVELLNDLGQIEQRQLWRIDSLGGAAGQFVLESPIHAGYYEVRAYTREMLNWGTMACFSRVVPVFDVPKNGKASIEEPRSTLAFGPKRRPKFEESDKSSFRRVEFYPEGGVRAYGVPQTLALRLVNGRGAAVSEEVVLYNKEGAELQRVQTSADGVATVLLPASVGGEYAKVAGEGKKFQLPAPNPSMPLSLHAFKEGEEQVLRIQHAEGGLVGLAVVHREQVAYFDTLMLDAAPVEFSLPEEALRDGVNRIVIFTPEGRTLASRLVWKMPDAPQYVAVEVRQNKEKYEPFEPIALSLRLSDAYGRPVQTNFSLSVNDATGDFVAEPEANIATSLLLASELRGYIHEPATLIHEPERLDHVLLTQGWEASRFDVMCGKDPFILKQPIEQALTLNGHVYKTNDRRVPMPDMDINLQMYSIEGGALSAQAHTDAEGRFAFESAVDFTGSWVAQFTMRDEGSARRWSRLAIDRWFDPAPRRWHADEIVPFRPYEPKKAQEVLPRYETFEWIDTIPRFLSSEMLGEAVVVHRNKYRGFTGNRYTYNGGPAAGKRHAEVYYDFATEVERYKDAGFYPETAYEFLAWLDAGTDYERNFDPDSYSAAEYGIPNGLQEQQEEGSELATMKLNETIKNLEEKMMFHNRPAKVYFNNSTSSPVEGASLMAEEIAGVAIMKVETAEKIMGSSVGNINAAVNHPEEYAIIFYEKPDYARYKGKKGVERRHIQGYSEPIPFRAPSYNGLDLLGTSDRRRTLYWNPNLQSDAEGRASAVFFNSSNKSTRLRVSAQGVSVDGAMVGN